MIPTDIYFGVYRCAQVLCGRLAAGSGCVALGRSVCLIWQRKSTLVISGISGYCTRHEKLLFNNLSDSSMTIVNRSTGIIMYRII